MSLQKFKQLREQTRTPAEFRKLAESCGQNAEEHRRNAERCELEMRGSHQAHLGTLALDYREMSKHWTELSRLLRQQAEELEPPL